MGKKTQVRTAADVRREFGHRGISIAEWARGHGVSSQLVHSVLSGRLQCRIGQSHKVAVLLGMKDGEVVN